jgi:hypothetical protein
MPRGYRLFFVALAGLALLGAHHPNTVTQPKQQASQKRSAHASQNIAPAYDEQTERPERPRITEPCKQGEEKRYSDLCAQWKAADSANLAAWLSGASFAAVLVALWFAFRSNWIARDTAKRQLRAYVGIEPLGVFERDDDGHIVVPLALKNAGQTPAYFVDIHNWFCISEDPVDFDPSKAERDPRPAFRPSELTIGPGETHTVYARMPFSPTGAVMDAISRKEFAIVHYGVVTYLDAFKVGRNSEFAHYHRGEELSDAEAKRCRLGNHST